MSEKKKINYRIKKNTNTKYICATCKTQLIATHANPARCYYTCKEVDNYGYCDLYSFDIN